MKTLVPLAVFLAVASLSVPACGEILVFKLSEKDISSFERVGGQWYTDKGKETGFLVLDLNLGTGEIDQASIVWYWTDAGTKWYEAYDIDGFELVVINTAKRQWVVVLKLDDVYMLLLEGKVKDTDIGTAGKANIAKGLKGYSIYDETFAGGDREMGVTQLSAKLDSKLTKLSNDPLGINQDFDLAVDEVLFTLEQKGYFAW